MYFAWKAGLRSIQFLFLTIQISFSKGSMSDQCCNYAAPFDCMYEWFLRVVINAITD